MASAAAGAGATKPRGRVFRMLSRRAVVLKKEEEERKTKEVQLYSDNSDSEEDVKVHDFRAADEQTGRMVYLRACDEQHLRPISNFMDKLSEELVSVRHHGLAPQMVEAMADTLKVNHCVKALDLAHNQLDDNCARLLSDALRINTTVQTLDLTGNRLTDKGAACVAGVLESLEPSLTSVSLAANKLGRKFIATMADAMSHNTTLLTLDVHRCGLSDAAALPLGHALDANAKLQELNLSWNDVRDGAGVAIAHGLAHGRLRQLDLSFNGLGDASATAFAECLRTNALLTSLDISHNRIGAEGAMAIAEVLPDNRTLVALRMGFNSLGFTATKAVITALGANSSLAVLGLENTMTGSVGAASAELEDAAREEAKAAPPPSPKKGAKGGAKGGKGKKNKKGGKDAAAEEVVVAAPAPPPAPKVDPKPAVVTMFEYVHEVCAARGKLARVRLEYPEITTGPAVAAYDSPRRKSKRA